MGFDPKDFSWYVVERTYWVLDKGLILVGSRSTEADFHAEPRDPVEIVRPNGSRTRARVQDVYPSQSHPGGDLLVDGLRQSDVPPGSRLRVLRSGGHKRRAHEPEEEPEDEPR